MIVEQIVSSNNLRFNEPLARYTTWHIGGPAKQYFRPRDNADLSAFLRSLPDDEQLFLVRVGQ